MAESTTSLSMTGDEVRAMQVHILQAVDHFCRRHDLRLYLWAGTLIGAVRHHGFIPWDDDVDLVMPREDYERFCKEFSDEETGSLRLFTSSTDAKYGYPFARVADMRTYIDEQHLTSVPMGVNVEIFPIDGWPLGRMRVQLQTLQLRLVRGLVAIRTDPPHPGRVRWKRAVISTLGRPIGAIPVRVLTGMATRIARSHAYETAEYVGVLVWGRAERVERSAYGSGRLAEFEGGTFLAPSNSDRVLRWHYGDYMQVPPLRERNALRHFEGAFWLATADHPMPGRPQVSSRTELPATTEGS